MALLPNPEEIARVAPRPSGSVASYNTAINRVVDQSGTIQAESNIDTGNRLTAMANTEIDRLDSLKAADAETALMRKELELQTQYTSVKGGDVLTPEFHNSYKEMYKQGAMEIEGGLSTPAQKARFQQIAKRREVSFDAQRTNYAVGETDKYEGQVYSGRMSALSENAKTNYTKPDVIAAAAFETEATFAREMVRRGITDPAILTTELKKVRGDFYAGLIDHAITEKDTVAANATFAASRGMLSDAQKQAVEGRLRPANDFAEGQSLAVEAQDMVTSGKTMAEVELALAKKATSPGAYNAAQTIFTNLQQANNKAQAEAEGSALMLYHTSGNPTKAKAIVLDSPAYQNLSPVQQVKVLDYMDADVQQNKQQSRADMQFGWALETRAENKAAKIQEQKYNSLESRVEFMTLITDPDLKNKSRQEIWSKVGTLGPTLVGKILTEQAILNTQEKPLTLDKDILAAAKPASLKKNSVTDKNDAYDGFVKEAILDWQALHPGKRPTVEEQKAIARSANTEYTTTGTFWDTSRKAYEELPTGKTAGEAQVKRGIIKAAAARGLTLTPEQLELKYNTYLKTSK